jgi:hypothetical protein
MGLDVTLTFGVRIERKKVVRTYKGCPKCAIEIDTMHCAQCGSKKGSYDVFNYLVDKDTWEDFTEKYDELWEVLDCDYYRDDYIYFTDSDCLDEAGDNPRAGDYMFFKAIPEKQQKFMEEMIKRLKDIFGIDLSPADFGYFIRMY